MTVSEYIEELKTLPQDAKVIKIDILLKEKTMSFYDYGTIHYI